ncbi:MAG TPA: dicarboxylate/amino acid:cation symporter [Thermoanaerobaculia bacterium]
MSGPRRFPFYARILLAMAAGAVLGLLAGPRAAPLGEAGKVIINLIKALAAPLLFFAILDAFLRTTIQGRSAARMVGVSLCNGAIALAIGLAISNILKPGQASAALQRAAASGAPMARPLEGLDFGRVVSGLVPTSVGAPFVENAILGIVVLGVLLGAALRRVKNEQTARGETGYRHVEDGVAALLRAFEVMLSWIIAIVPLAVFGVVAQTVGQHGFAPFAGLGPYVGVALLGLALQVFVVYQAWLVLVAKVSLRWFWGGARDAVAYAAGASSSLATLPVTLRCLDRMEVSPAAARLAACVGTNLNNDGILLYEAMAVLFVAQAHGIAMTLPQQIAAALMCLIAGVGIAGVPEAGLISLSLVLATVGLPLQLLPLLLTVDWLLSRARAMTNVTSDMLVAVVLDRLARRSGPVAEPAERVPATG